MASLPMSEWFPDRLEDPALDNDYLNTYCEAAYNLIMEVPADPYCPVYDATQIAITPNELLQLLADRRLRRSGR